MVIYVSGPISLGVNFGKRGWKKKFRQNIDKGLEIAAKLWRMGYFVYSPHANTGFTYLINDIPKIPYRTFISGDLKILQSCDCIFMMPQWKKSRGALIEYRFAKDRGIPVLTSLKQARLFIKKHGKKTT